MHNTGKSERETIIIFDDDESQATVYSTSPKVIRQLERKIGKGKQIDKHHGSFQWVIPKEWVKLPSKKRKNISEDHKRKLHDALSKAREARKKS